MKRRIKIFVGHFGSGKSEVAINEALAASDSGLHTTLADLDVVKPYFRCRLLRETLQDRGVQLIAPEGDRFYADLPIILPEIKGAITDPSRFVCLDAGGDDTGARVLGSFADAIPEGRYEMLLVLNMKRPFTDDTVSTLSMVERIVKASRLHLTGVISNTHLMDETTPEIVEQGYTEACELAARLGIEVRYVAAETSVADSLEPRRFDCSIRKIQRYILPPFVKTPQGRRPLRKVI